MGSGKERKCVWYLQMTKLNQIKVIGQWLLGLGVVSLISIFSYQYWFIYSDPQANPGFACDVSSGGESVGEDGWIITSKITSCGGFGGGSEFYVYAHKDGEPLRAGNLVFKYTNFGIEDEMHVIWKRRGDVEIAIDHEDGILKMRDNIGSLKITYRINGVLVNQKTH